MILFGTIPRFAYTKLASQTIITCLLSAKYGTTVATIVCVMPTATNKIYLLYNIMFLHTVSFFLQKNERDVYTVIGVPLYASSALSGGMNSMKPA